MAADTERKRVHFLSPEELVEQADALADVMGTDRTDVINDALREYIQDATADEQFRQRVAEAYYADRIGFDLIEALVGAEQARTFQLLKRDLESEPLDIQAPDESVDVYDGETATADLEE